jgi:UDP-N-acetyl-D-mannosaminuronic acid dehydrogenase
MAMELHVSAFATPLKNWLPLPSPNTMNLPFETISIVGLGYIGLPTAAVFASLKVKVIGVDVNQHVVDTINRGQIHIVEPDLDMMVHAAVRDGYLRATTRPEPADVFIIAVPTPFKVGPTGPHHPDMDYIELASKSIAAVLKAGDLVILESTSPVGATEQMGAWLAEARSDLTFPQTHGVSSDIRIAHCPERVLPGQVLRELVQNDRVIGGMTPKCSEAATRLYKTFVQGECVITNARTAEMCKLTENSFRDVNIAFANELSIICDKMSINVWELIKLANRHPRVNILQPGPGVGGHCIAVDPWFIVSQAPDQAHLIRAARQVNDGKPEWVIDKVKLAIADYLQANPEKTSKDLTIACFGLAFKPDIDDLRESPALAISTQLARLHSGELLIVEPCIESLPDTLIDRARLVTVEHAQDRAHIALILVAHKAFKDQPYEAWKKMSIVDSCGILSASVSSML